MDAGNMIKPMLARGELRMVGATTLDEYRQHIEKDPALERRFQQVLVGEPSASRTPSASCAGSRSATRCTTASGSPTPRWSPPPRCPTATSPPGSCRTRPSTWSTRPRPGSGWRSTRGRSRSTRSSGPSAGWRSRRWRWRRSPTPRRVDRLAALRAELAEQREELSALTARWQNEKRRHRGHPRAQGAARAAARRVGAGRARRRPRPGRPSCATGASRRWRRSSPRQTAVTERQEQVMLKEEVGPDDVADVVSAWTGIPAGRLLEGETAKLLRMEDELGKRVVGQAEAVRAVSDAVRRARAGHLRREPAHRVVPVPRPDRRRQDRAGQGAGRVPVRRRARDGPHRHERVLREALAWPGWSARPPATSATTRAGSSPRPCGAARTRWCCSTRSRRRTRTCSTSLLQVLDDGRLTDGQGRTVDFRNTILVLTSNLGSQAIGEPDAGRPRPRGTP